MSPPRLLVTWGSAVTSGVLASFPWLLPVRNSCRRCRRDLVDVDGVGLAPLLLALPALGALTLKLLDLLFVRLGGHAAAEAEGKGKERERGRKGGREGGRERQGRKGGGERGRERERGREKKKKRRGGKGREEKREERGEEEREEEERRERKKGKGETLLSLSQKSGSRRGNRAVTAGGETENQSKGK